MKTLLTFSILLTLLISCKKSDLVPPTLTIATVNNEASTILNFSPGETFVVRTNISDNVALGQFKIDIHQDFDGHSHKNTTVRYAEIRISNITGTSFDLEETFTIPSDASSGVYHGTIRALDDEGNTSEPVIFYFNVVRENQPIVVMNLPQTIGSGTSLQVDGNLSSIDNADLKTVSIRVRSTKTGNTLHDENYILNENTTLWNPFIDGNVTIPIPADEDEKIIFRIRVEDSNGNNTIFETEIIIV